MTFHHIRTPAQHFTPGADEKRAACDGRWSVFDALIDHQNGPVALAAKRRALDLCGSCPLRQACWAANRDEVWLLRMTSPDLPSRRWPDSQIKHGTPSGYAKHKQNREDACQDCLEAKRSYDREYYAAKRSRRAAA